MNESLVLDLEQPVHLADIVQDEMAERGWTITDLVKKMGPHFTVEDWGVCQLSWELFFSVRDRDVILGDVMANQLADAFDVEPQFFNNLHENWRTWAKKQPKEAEGLVRSE